MITRNDFRREDWDYEHSDGYTLWPRAVDAPVEHVEIEYRPACAKWPPWSAACFFSEDGAGYYDVDRQRFDTAEDAEAWAIARVNARPARVALARLSQTFHTIACILAMAGDTAPDLCEWLAARGPEVVP